MRKIALSPDLKYPWQEALFEALIEYHPERMRDKFTAAEMAISRRLVQRPPDADEVLSLRYSLSSLKVLYPETGTDSW